MQITPGINFNLNNGGFTMTAPTAALPTVSADPYWENVSLLVNAEDGAIDKSTYNNTATFMADATRATSTVKYGTRSIGLDGNGDYVNITESNSAFDFGTGDFTVEMWAYPTAWVASQTLFASSVTTNDFFIALNPNVGNVIFGRNYVAIDATTSNALNLNSWNHIAVVKDSNVLKIFINGELGVSVGNTVAYGCTGNQMSIGAGFTGAGAGSWFNGYIDEVRVTKGVARYKSAFTPPGSALPTSGSTYTYTGYALNNASGLGAANGGALTFDLSNRSDPAVGGTALFDTGIPYTTLEVIYGDMANGQLGNPSSGAPLYINGVGVTAQTTWGESGWSASYTKKYTATNGTLNSIGIGPAVSGSYASYIVAIIVDGVKLLATGPTWN